MQYSSNAYMGDTISISCTGSDLDWINMLTKSPSRLTVFLCISETVCIITDFLYTLVLLETLCRVYKSSLYSLAISCCWGIVQ